METGPGIPYERPPYAEVPEAEFRLGISKLPSSDVHFGRFKDRNLGMMQQLLTVNEPYKVLFYPDKKMVKALNRLSNNQFESVALAEFNTIIDRANGKKEELMILLYQDNPYSSCWERYAFCCKVKVIKTWSNCCANANCCVALLKAFLTLYLVYIGMYIWALLTIFACLVDIFICYSCRTAIWGYSDEYVKWVADKLERHPELDSNAVDQALCEEMQALCRSLNVLLDKRVEFWTGVESVENGSSPNYDRDEFVILINRKEVVDQDVVVGAASSMV
jgi:hypothetical protein